MISPVIKINHGIPRLHVVFNHTLLSCSTMKCIFIFETRVGREKKKKKRKRRPCANPTHAVGLQYTALPALAWCNLSSRPLDCTVCALTLATWETHLLTLHLCLSACLQLCGEWIRKYPFLEYTSPCVLWSLHGFSRPAHRRLVMKKQHH